MVLVLADRALGSLAHAVHYTIVVAGTLGVLALLLGGAVTERVGRRRVPDAHERRVAALRGALIAPPAGSAQRAGAPPDRPARPALTGPRRVAVLSSVVAAGVHALVGPEHFAEGLALGLFFIAATALQLGWAVLVVLRPSRALLAAGSLGNLAVVALWATTRTVGLPFGLLPGPEEIGLWDVLATGAEVVLVTAAALAMVAVARPASVHGTAVMP